jgi:hypothetical protein
MTWKVIIQDVIGTGDTSVTYAVNPVTSILSHGVKTHASLFAEHVEKIIDL